jgi:DNA gyrase/topoisomerase IV subunit A
MFDRNHERLASPVSVLVMHAVAVSDNEDVAYEEASARHRLEFLDAMLAAIERRTEVVDLIAESETADEARASLRALLGISELAATAIIDLQLRRFAKLERSRILDERDEIQRILSR